MKTIKFVIHDPMGLHARPAGTLVKEASRFEAEINMVKDTKSVNAKRIFSVMSLQAKQGDTLTITIQGIDEEPAADAMQRCAEKI